MWKELEENRNAVMSVMFESIKYAISRMQTVVTQNAISRMADFECFCTKVNPNIRGVFEKLIEEQKEFSEDAFTDLFSFYCKNSTMAMINVTALDLAVDMAKFAKSNSISTKYIALKSKAIARYMKRKYSFCTITSAQGPEHKATYNIVITCERTSPTF